MMGITELKLRWRALIHRRAFNRDIDDELSFHLALRQHSMRAQDIPNSSAARRRFGNPTRVGEDLREMRGWGFAERLWQDLRYALRQLRRNPGFAAGAILPLALAIGCIASVFTLTDAVLFRPTGVKDPSRITAIYTLSRSQNRYLSDSYPDFRDIGALSGLIDSTGAYLRTSLGVRISQGSERMNAELVTGDYFRAAGITPALGRALTPDDDRPGAPAVALASYSLWETRFAKSPSILGFVIWINQVPFTIVGVMPQGYQGMLLDWYPDCSLWTPLVHFDRIFPSNTAGDFRHRREIQMLMLLARLRPGVNLPQLQAALDVLAPRVAARSDYRFIAFPSSEARFFPAYRTGTLHFLWMLLAVSAAAVAIACFNLASLLLARAASRQHEIGTRLAIGASRSRVLQQFMIENAVLAMAACALSLPAAFAATYWLRDAPIMDGFTLSLDLSPDGRALTAGMLAGLITAIAAGILPALRASKNRGSALFRPPLAKWVAVPAFRQWDIFIAAQIACAMTILVPAAMLAQNLRDLGSAHLGYDPRGVLLGSTAIQQVSGPGPALLTELRSQAPEAALASTALPSVMRSAWDVTTNAISWEPVSFSWVSDGYFDLLRIPILSGRAILSSDDPRSQPVVVLNQSAASLLWPGENPVGRRLRLRAESADREVVGVVEDIRLRPLGRPLAPEPYLFLPLFQSRSTGLVIHVRTLGPPLQFASTLRQIVARIAPDAALADIRTLTSQVDDGLKPMHLAAQATGAVSLLGILLAVAGMFAACAYRVTQQRKEIAIRIAIGAEPGRVIRAFASRGMWIGITGACLGLLPALWGARLLRASIAGANLPSTPLYIAAALALAIASSLAAFAAARRIARVQPSDVLRVQ
jgi:macrolide transport system ATP-binding/permease protein